MNWWDVEIFIDKCIDTVKDNPVKTLATVGMVAAGAATFFYAPPIAVAIVAKCGTATASTGTLISSLSGAAATNASLAFMGGGAVSAGGFGMAGGTAAVTAIGTAVGGAAGGAISKIAT